MDFTPTTLTAELLFYFYPDIPFKVIIFIIIVAFVKQSWVLRNEKRLHNVCSSMMMVFPQPKPWLAERLPFVEGLLEKSEKELLLQEYYDMREYYGTKKCWTEKS